MEHLELSMFRLLDYFSPGWAVLVAAFLVLVTLAFSLYLLFDHLSSYKNPEEQKFIIGVILMVPCYSVESIISLAKPSISVDIEILRDCYEAFAMYCFGRYLVACLGGEERTVEFMEREGRRSSKSPLLGGRGTIEHPFPMNLFLNTWILGPWFYRVAKIGIVQYMIIKTMTAILAVILQAFGSYCEGEFKLGCGYIYVAAVLNFSQSWALYCLVQFYAVTKDELAHIKPLYKFLSFKSIVFLTWWQGVAIALICSLGLFKSPIAKGLQFQSSVQDFIICIEMGIASVVHFFVFPAKPYKLMGEQFHGNVSVLGDYAAVDCAVDPEEVRDSERPTKLRHPQLEGNIRSGMSITESVRDVVVGGGGFVSITLPLSIVLALNCVVLEQIVKDVKFTVNKAVEPVEKGITKINDIMARNMKRREKRAKDDSFIEGERVIKGIDDPLLNGSASDSALQKGKRHRKVSGFTAAHTAGETSDSGYSAFQVRGIRWITKE